MGGVEYYRMMKPNHFLSGIYPEFEFTSVNTLEAPFYNEVPNEDFIKGFDLVYFCRGIDAFHETKNSDLLKKLQIPFGLDLDDYWFLPTYHILYNAYKEKKTPQSIIAAIEQVVVPAAANDDEGNFPRLPGEIQPPGVSLVIVRVAG